MSLPLRPPVAHRSTRWWATYAAGYVLLVGASGASLPLLVAAGLGGVWLLAHSAFGTWHLGDILAEGVLRNATFGVALLSVGFQVALLVEQVARLGMWFRSPAAPPYMTAWTADVGARLQLLAPGVPALGARLVDLLAALAILTGLLLMARLTAGCGGPGPHLQRVRRLQAALVAEHALLTLSVVVLGRPAGASTAFGMLPAGPVAWTVQTALGAVVAALVTWHALGAVREARAAGFVGLGDGPVAPVV